MTTTILVCDTCRFSAEEKLQGEQTGGQILGAHIAARLPEGVRMRHHSCLMGCAHSCNAALSESGKYTYVLGGFRPEPDAAEALLAYARLYAESPTGQVAFRLWPGGIRGRFIARIPPAPEPAD